jgi:hypothetical protein
LLHQKSDPLQRQARWRFVLTHHPYLCGLDPYLHALHCVDTLPHLHSSAAQARGGMAAPVARLSAQLQVEDALQPYSWAAEVHGGKASDY